MIALTGLIPAVLCGLAHAAPRPAVTQIADGQVQAGDIVTQIADGQIQAGGAGVATQIGDGQVQAGGAATPYPVNTATEVEAINQSGNVPGYTNADAPFASYTPTPLSFIPSVFGPDSTVPAIYTVAPTGTQPGAAAPLRKSDFTGPTSHGPFSGVATVTGAVANSPLGATIPALPPNPTATYYNTNGALQQPQPIPYQPAGGLGTNGTLPRYMVNSDFDYESLVLGLYQEWIELDLFNNGLALFSDEDFLDAGLTAEDRAFIAFMAQQEEGHATLVSNMLGETAPPQCTYDYPFKNVREFVDFNQLLTRWGEAGVWGFINHLDSREVGQLLAQSIATEARQEMAFRQMSGMSPMPYWFAPGIPQSWQWTYLAPYISSCPENTTRVAWQNFPALHVKNQANPNRFSPNDTGYWERVDNRTSSPATIPPANESCIHVNVTGYSCGPAISRNRSEPLTFPGRQVLLEWDTPGQLVGPNNSYVTNTTALGAPAFVAWTAQLNLTYTALTVTGPNTGYTYQPAGFVYEGGIGIVNETTFIALTDTDTFYTPFNLSMINPHVIALGVYVAG